MGIDHISHSLLQRFTKRPLQGTEARRSLIILDHGSYAFRDVLLCRASYTVAIAAGKKPEREAKT
jgi:hypothetical protein